MRSFGVYVVGAALLGNLGAGCGAANEPCPRPVGVYYGTYGILDGNCLRITGFPLKFPDDNRSQILNIETATGLPMNTELNRVGCKVGLKQNWVDQGNPAALQGDLAVEDKALLSGQLLYMEYMPDGTTPRCQSRVGVTYELNDGVTIGAAAQAATALP